MTFRLADSLPPTALDKLRAESAILERQFDRATAPFSAEDMIRRTRLKSEKYLEVLDQGLGKCVLRQDEISGIVAGALRFFDKQRYLLYAWCVMPNHVHTVVQPIPGFELAAILHSWKSFSAKQANAVLGRTGTFWQSESYDHLIRDDAEFEHYMQYTRDNPAAAGLKDWKWVG